MADPALGPLLVSVAERVLTITVFIAVGVGLANVAVAFGAVDRIGALAAPLTRPANLPREVGTAILATTASPTAGYGMLAECRESGVLAGALLLSETNVDTTVDPEVDAGATTAGSSPSPSRRSNARSPSSSASGGPSSGRK